MQELEIKMEKIEIPSKIVIWTRNKKNKGWKKIHRQRWRNKCKCYDMQRMKYQLNPLKSKWKVEYEQDIECWMHEDIEDMLVKMISDQVKIEIDPDIKTAYGMNLPDGVLEDAMANEMKNRIDQIKGDNLKGGEINVSCDGVLFYDGCQWKSFSQPQYFAEQCSQDVLQRLKEDNLFQDPIKMMPTCN